MSHVEISAVINLDAVQDNALFAMDVTGGIYKRKNGYPISVVEREHSTVALSQLFISFEGYFNRVIYLLSDIDEYKKLSNEKNSAKRLEGLLSNSI
jgi:hypothetical protein